MPLSKQEIDNLIQLIRRTKDVEINCEQCLGLVAEFAERNLAGGTIDDGMRAVEHHLSICEECREEFEALQNSLDEFGNDEAGQR